MALEQLTTTGHLYNLSYAFHLKGDLNLTALNRSLETVLKRQEVLRTTFGTVEGQPGQIIQPSQPVDSDLTDLSDMPLCQAREQILADIAQPFDLKHAPAFRYHRYRLADDEYVLGFTFHHIISDYWSENLFFKELSTCYEAFSDNNEPSLKPLAIRYADFAVWQRQWLSQPGMLAFLLNYWHPQLQGLAQPDLPADHSSGETQRQVEFRKIMISADQVTEIRELARRTKVQPFTILLTALNLVLAEHLKTSDVAVFSPITNRHRPELQHLMGDFSNLLILRTDLSGNPTITDLLQRAGQVVSGAIAHQDLPLQLIKASIPLKLPQVSFSYLNIPQETLTLPNMAVEPWDLGLGTNDFDLFLLMMEQKGRTEGYLKYNTNLFSQTTIQKMTERFQTILTAMIAQPGQPIPLLRSSPILKPPGRKFENGLLIPIPELVDQIQHPFRKSGKETVLRQQLGQALSEERYEILKKHVKSEIKRIVGIVPADDQGFFDLGLNSLTSIQLRNRLSMALDISLPATITLEYPTVARLADYLAGMLFGKQQTVTDPPETLTGNSLNPEPEPIAIVGMGCRFPGGAHTPEQFWQLLREGRDALGDIPRSRWPVDDYYDPAPGTPGKMYTKQASFLQHPIEEFDPHFFGISSAEGQYLDPRHRLLLEVSWEALENAGLPADRLPTRTGIFVGLMESEKGMTNGLHDIYGTTGTLTSMAAGRLAYLLGAQGPNMVIDTACSSSLLAVHLACQSLRAGECQAALCGGVNVLLFPKLMIGLSGMTVLSPDGRCKTFDASADGFGRGEGCGMVVLKRLSCALEDRDRIWAVIRASAVNHNGPGSGLTVPSKAAQTALIREALEKANIEGKEVGYVEAHGTGTKLGDPIEVRALADALGNRDTPLLIGSVKTNIGHLDASAGIAGLIKTALVLHHQEIPPHLNFSEPNPLIDWANLPFKVPLERMTWAANDKARIAGTSAFGLSGTNAHVILAEALPKVFADSTGQQAPDRTCHVLTISGKTEQALADQVSRYLEYLSTHPDLNLADVCYTANTGRVHFEHRLGIVAHDLAELQGKLAAYQQGERAEALAQGRIGSEPPKIAFLFTGQGSQYADMGRELYETQPLFREVMTECDEILRAYLDIPLTELLYGEDKENNERLLTETRHTQPALFAIEYALARLWQSWGIEPAAVIGHSVGEYVAACLAGVFGPADGLKLVAERGRLMHALPRKGLMVAVRADEAGLREKLASYGGRVVIAGLNAPRSLVLSGESGAVTRITEQLQAEGTECKLLNTSHAFHSALVEPMLAEFGEITRTIRYAEPGLGLISNLTGKQLAEITPAYWVEHVRQPVRFAEGISTLAGMGTDIFVEVGPKPTLLGLGQQCLTGSHEHLWLPSLYPRQQTDWSQMLKSLAQLYVYGANIDWQRFDEPYPRQKITLPTYPFQRKRYWTDQKPRGTSQNADGHPLTGQKIALSHSAETVFQSHLSASFPAYLDDHRVFGQVVLPGAAYLEMALEASQQLAGSSASFIIRNVTFQRPLILTDEETTVQTVFSPSDEGWRWQIFSQSAAGEEWILHSAGEAAEATDGLKPASQYKLSELQSRCQTETPVKAHYMACSEAGLDYGPGFQGLEEMYKGEGESLGLVRLSGSLQPESGTYQLHPALSDACLQVSLSVAESDDPLLPFALDQLCLYGADNQHAVWSYACLRKGTGAETRTIDITLLSETGELLAELSGLTLRPVSQQAMSGSSLRTDWLYQLDWQPMNLPRESPYESQAGRWLIVSDQTDQADELAQLLQAEGEQADLITNDELQGGLCSDELTDHRGVIYLAPRSGDDGMPQAALEVSIQVLQLIQTIVEHQGRRHPRIWLVTEEAVGDGVTHPDQATLWGLGRTVSWEHPELQCSCLDLETDTPAETLFETIWFADKENQIAIRQGRPHIARLERYDLPMQETQQNICPFQVRVGEYGLLESLDLVPASRRPPGPGQVEVQVRAAGLNFKDVLHALGLLKDFYPPELGRDDPANQPFGFECSGKVVDMGTDVTDFEIGDEVIVWHCPGSLAEFVTADSDHVSRKPRHLSFEEAATIPINFLTAYYGLHELGRMKKGDRVLIHAAAGGVGQAAVQLAQYAGAEIFATASLSKRNFLRSQGIENVMDSRTFEFADQIRQITGGQGADLVLNSINGEHIEKSFDVLARNGRFIEIGKIDIWDEHRARTYRPDVYYAAFDLGDEEAETPGLIGAMQAKLGQLFSDGKLKPHPYHSFPIGQVSQAFRFMSRARHIGKIVLSVPEQTEQQKIRPGKSYLITGGLGGLGLEVARYLARSGASHLILSSRRGAETETARESLRLMEESGAQVSVVRADVSQEADVVRLLTECRQSAPLGGIIHAAGLLDDGILSQQNRERFTKVFAPKVRGSWYLHQHTREMPLDFFVCFSSQSSLLGNGGQTNYAAANAFMDSLAAYRQAQGLPALSINWGAWSGVGMARDLLGDSRGISPKQGVALFGALLDRDMAQAGVMPIRWKAFVRQLPARVKPPVLDVFLEKSEPAQAGNGLRQQVTQASDEERYELLRQYVRTQVKIIVGITRADDDQNFSEMGMDSLMSIQLANHVLADIGFSVSVNMISEHPTISKLSQVLSEMLVAENKYVLRASKQGLTDDYEEGEI
ncbi:Putative phthiocerol synthesis polyketide synthase [Desulfonema magnum]|uniref:Phthiocerol synthesis polyketide synthase n=1 Tax=Desulfonema magnum TaxID=45655 RepID=A0A975GPE3_9BACT|nr:Putative phthiocerol synthesis polyketide synthase [Desulfonema magnum]